MRSKVHLFIISALLLGMVLIDIGAGITSVLLVVVAFILLKRIGEQSSATATAEMEAEICRLNSNIHALTTNPFESSLFGIDTKVRAEIISSAERLASLESSEGSLKTSPIRWLPVFVGVHIAVLLIQMSLTGVSEPISVIPLSLLPILLHMILFDSFLRGDR